LCEKAPKFGTKFPLVVVFRVNTHIPKERKELSVVAVGVHRS